MLQLAHITKRFGPMTALQDVSLELRPGAVHGLLGENGAGKSTLMNILFGLLRADAGEIRIDGKAVQIRSPRAAQRLGIGMVHQHFKLVPTLTVAQNFAVALGSPVRRVRGRAAEIGRQLTWDLPLESRVERLAVGQQQRVEIVKALLATAAAGGPRTLILDEPTAVLTPQEARELFAAMRRLKDGGAAIVFISHKLAEVQAVCDEVTILRRGKNVHSGPAAELSPTRMATLMVGAAVELPRLERDGTPGKIADEGVGTTVGPTAACLRLEKVHAGMLQGVSLVVNPGEIVGVAGVDGNGRSDLVQAIVGGLAVKSGALQIHGDPATRASIRWRADRLAYVPEDRQRQAMVMELPVRDNLLLKEYRDPPYSTLGWLRFGAWRKHARDLARQYDVRLNSLMDAAGQLSGGNQQKMVLARELHDERKKLVIAANPTRGLDIGATAFVMRQLLAARRRGAGVLLVHSDLDELLAISDRVLVMFNGMLSPSRWPAGSKEEIGRQMLGLLRVPPAAGAA